MSEAILAKVTLESGTGQPADSVSNSFVIRGNEDMIGGVDPEAIADRVAGFYNFMAPDALVTIGDLLSPVLDNTADAARVDLYDISAHLDGSPAGSPFFSYPFQLNAPAGAGQALPAEVAVVATLEAFGRADQPVEAPDDADADIRPERPRQRYTGRIYLGPLNNICVSIVDSVARPSSAVRDTLQLAIRDLSLDLAGIDDTIDGLGVWSRESAVVRLVSRVSTDNAFDTQRRRGERSTIRTSLAI